MLPRVHGRTYDEVVAFTKASDAAVLDLTGGRTGVEPELPIPGRCGGGGGRANHRPMECAIRGHCFGCTAGLGSGRGGALS